MRSVSLTRPTTRFSAALYGTGVGAAQLPLEVFVAPAGAAALSVAVVVAPMGVAALPVEVLVAPMGVAALPVAVEVYGLGDAALPVAVLVAPMGAASLPVDVIVAPAGVAALPLELRTGPSGAAALAVAVSVVPPGILSGAETVTARAGESAVWTAIVTLGGADISGRVVGEIVVDAEEGAARIAEFTLKPVPGVAVFLPSYVGQPVTVDVADYRGGVAASAMRLFTGKVDRPDLDLAARTIRLRCTDDLQGRCLTMTPAQVAELVGGHYSAAVFDAAADGWTHAQDRLSTVPASLDISPEGALRVTPWAASVPPHLVFDEDLIGDGSLTVSHADGAGLINCVDIEFDYRFPRVKAENWPIDYAYVNETNFAAYVADGKWFLQRDAVAAAIGAAGGVVESLDYLPMPTEPIELAGGAFWSPGPADADLCTGFSAAVSFDYAQEVEERHRITVAADASIAAVGLRRQSLRGAMEGVYPDVAAVEAGMTLYRKSVSGIPPQDVATPVLGKTVAEEVTLSAETDRAAANAAMETLIAIAKTRIWASHRRNSVGGAVPLNPALDLDKTVAVVASGVEARGKVTRVSHRLSPDTGAAVSEFAIALCAVAGVGIVHDETPTVAPAGTAPTQTDLVGSAAIAFANGVEDDHTLAIEFPAVAEIERAAATPVIASAYAAPLAEDLFTVTL